MQPRLSPKRNAAMSLFEVGVVIAVVLILAVFFLSRAAKQISPETVCINNQRQMALAYKIWAGDNNDTLPTGISSTNGGALELIATGNVASVFQVMSNELSVPKILICPADARNEATDFTRLTRTNISYFVGLDFTNDTNPQLILSGDTHFEFSSLPVKPGIHTFAQTDPVGWSSARHPRTGNLGLTDGSVQPASSNQLHNFFVSTGVTTNRFAIP